MKWNTSAFISSTIEWTPTLPTRFATMSSAPILTASALPVDYSLLPALLHYYHYYCQYLSQYLIYLLATPQFCVSAYIYPSAISYLQPPTTFLPSILPLIPPNLRHYHYGALRASKGRSAKDGAIVSWIFIISQWCWRLTWNRGDGACGKTSALNVFTRGWVHELLNSLPFPPCRAHFFVSQTANLSLLQVLSYSIVRDFRYF